MSGISWARKRAIGAGVAALTVASVFAGTAAPAVSAPSAGASNTAISVAAQAQAPATGSVIVQAVPGAADAAKAAIEAAGGKVTRDLPLIDGFEANLPERARITGEAAGSIVSITPNRRIEFEEFSYDDASSTTSNFAKASGATAAWTAGSRGEGVGVAVIDTGISPMKDFEGRLVHGPDLSGEGTLIDTFGHGTVMAGVAGGSGADSAVNGVAGYTGVAPKATLVAVKTAGKNGVTDVSTILEAMHWVSAYKDQYNIRVLNLSWGTTSTQDPAVDPLNYAVERLWKQGIVVVVAAGNAGNQAYTITKPGDDPAVITVGAYDDKQDTDLSNDGVTSWSSKGPTAAGLTKPDVVAPGRTLISPRSYGSTVEKENPKALISPSYIKGSGTSQASALTSGLVALLLAKRPDLTPDQVKYLLKSTASPISGTNANAQGSGRVRIDQALNASAANAPVQPLPATGLGSLEASRGGRNVETDCQGDGVIDVIKGEITYRCVPWDGTSWTGTSWTGTSWTGTSWTGTSWTGTSWTGTSWTGTSWTTGEWTTGEWGDEFLTAFWGNHPKKRLPGEVSEIEISRALPQRA